MALAWRFFVFPFLLIVVYYNRGHRMAWYGMGILTGWVV
jgi:hypothetical protein